MRFASRGAISQMKDQDTYSVVLGVRGTNLYRIELKEEELCTMDIGPDISTINDLHEEDHQIYAGTRQGIFNLRTGENVAVEGENVNNLDRFDDDFVYCTTNGQEVRTQQDEVLWSNSEALIKQICEFNGDLYVATHEGTDNEKKRLHRLDDGLVDEFDMPGRSGDCFMTSHQGELHGNFAGSTWKLSDAETLEQIYDGGYSKEGVFDCDSTLLEATSTEGIYETLSEKDDPVVPSGDLPFMSFVTTVSERSLRNIDAEVVEEDDIEVRGDWKQ